MKQVAEYYNEDHHDEWERLDRHPVELAVTMRAFNEFLPSPPARILDVGGGPGRYSVALAKQGYDVTLTDLAQESLKRAATYAQAANVRLVEIRAANALDLSAFPPSSYDALLLMGPLYHLTASEDRALSVRQAWQMLKPGGTIFASFLIAYSALRVCAERFPQWLYENQDYADKILTTGVHNGEWGFTTAYYAQTKDVQPFMEANGFNTLQIIGCEGIVGHTQATMNTLTEPEWEWWADLNYRLGKEPDLHSSSTHLLYVGRKRG